MLSHFTYVAMGLFGKLPGRGNDQSPNFTLWAAMEALQDWKNKGCGFSCACLGKAEKIASG